MPPDPPAWFEVSYVGKAVEQFRLLRGRARVAGRSSEWAATLGRIVRRLAADPRGTGDPLRPFNGLRLVLYQAVIDRVRVQYAVHDIRPVVFIRDITPVLDHPLRED